MQRCAGSPLARLAARLAGLHLAALLAACQPSPRTDAAQLPSPEAAPAPSVSAPMAPPDAAVTDGASSGASAAPASARPLPPAARLLGPLRGTSATGFVAMTAGSGREHVVVALPAQSEPPDADRPVLVASFTKLWVAVAVLRAVARKELALDDEIRTLLPALRPKPWSSSTLRDLLSHTSRVPELDEAGGFYSRTDVDFTSPVAVLAKHLSSSVEKSGVWKYRNAEFALLGAILQERAGRPIEEVLAREVFEPSGMTHSGVLVRRAPAGLELAPVGALRPQNFFTAGNGYASANDLLAFFDALGGEKLLDSRSRTFLFDATTSPDRAAHGCWAYAFPLEDAGSTLLVERPGSFGNVRLLSAFFPEEHRAIVLWSRTPLEVGRPRKNGSLAAKLARLALE